MRSWDEIEKEAEEKAKLEQLRLLTQDSVMKELNLTHSYLREEIFNLDEDMYRELLEKINQPKAKELKKFIVYTFKDDVFKILGVLKYHSLEKASRHASHYFDKDEYSRPLSYEIKELDDREFEVTQRERIIRKTYIVNTKDEYGKNQYIVNAEDELEAEYNVQNEVKRPIEVEGIIEVPQNKSFIFSCRSTKENDAQDTEEFAVEKSFKNDKNND